MKESTLAKELEGGGSSFVELLNDITATKRAGGSVSILPELYTLQAVCNRTGKG